MMLRSVSLPFPRSPPLHTEAAGTAPPDAFGSFRVLHQIGAGTLGPVFRAYDAEGERLVAVKLFKLDLPPDRVHRLVAELERLVAADLKHPALAAPIAAGIVDLSAYLACEYVAADSLDLAIRERGPASPTDTVRVAREIAGALSRAVSAGFSHGALHPRDILFSADETRVTGVGLARALEIVGVPAPVRRPYTAPERIAGNDWDDRADVFSLAAIVYEVLSGRRTSGAGARAVDGLQGIAGADLEAVKQVFARALAENPAERTSTALAFVDDLERVLRNSAAARSPAPPLRRTSAGEPRPQANGLVSESEPLLPLDEPRFTDINVEPEIPAIDARHSVPRAPEPLVSFSDEAFVLTASEHEPPSSPDLMLPRDDPFPDAREDMETATIDQRLLEQSRSAIWPLALALLIGVTLGFAAGYGIRDRQTPAATMAGLSASAPAPVGREFTETIVPDPPVPSAVERPKPAAEVGRVEAPKPTATTARSEPDVRGRLLVRSTPAGAHVLVDDRDAGRTPVALGAVAVGPHRVSVAREGYAADERRIVITRERPSQTVSFSLGRVRPAVTHTSRPPTPPAASPPSGHPTGVVVIESRPAGAKIYVDGRLVGSTPLTMPAMAAGEHAIRLEHDGYRGWSSSVRVNASERNRVTASLER